VSAMFGRPSVPSVQAAAVPSDAFLLDVREDDEWAAGHVDGALHIPLMDLPDRIGEVPTDQPVTVVCRVGGRSAQATTWLVQQGYDAYNLDGGMFAWASAGRAMVCDSGAEASVL
jgi:rhodanese-related sulfurtransferase